jgi:hypothetical protein
MGLAYGMNLLIRNLCKAKYVLLLEEDWLYLDDLVAPQTPERKRAIATSIALIENTKRNNVTSYDGRNILGVFLRHETYESFLTFPQADIWERMEDIDIQNEVLRSTENDSCSSLEKLEKVVIDYRIFCADISLKGNSIWGSYTNGAGLYNRDDLMKTGRMFGEPGDAFHDRYIEGNFAFRVALKNCHAALRLTNDTSCSAIHDPSCAGAFHHIGGGRSTRPRTPKGTKCEDVSWNFFGTPLYRKYHTFLAQSTGKETTTCTNEELQELRDFRFREKDSKEYREQTQKENEDVFRREAQERQKLRDHSKIILDYLETDPKTLRQVVPWMTNLSDEEIKEKAYRLERLANSPHPLEGYWDLHGRVLES